MIKLLPDNLKLKDAGATSLGVVLKNMKEDEREDVINEVVRYVLKVQHGYNNLLDYINTQAEEINRLEACLSESENKDE